MTTIGSCGSTAPAAASNSASGTRSARPSKSSMAPAQVRAEAVAPHIHTARRLGWVSQAMASRACSAMPGTACSSREP